MPKHKLTKKQGKRDVTDYSIYDDPSDYMTLPYEEQNSPFF